MKNNQSHDIDYLLNKKRKINKERIKETNKNNK